MAQRNLFLSVMLLSLFSALGAGLSVYAAVRGAVALEGGNLRSATAVKLDSFENLDGLENAGVEVSGRLLTDLDDSGRFRAVRTLGHPAPLPIHEGRQIREGEEGVALIGDQVGARSDHGRQYIDYDGRAFVVVGRLGVRADSGLAHDVLLQDRGLVDIDGPVLVDIEGGIESLDGFGTTGATSIDGRTDQRTNIDYVSPILIVCGWGLTLVGASASGLIIANFSRPVATLHYQLGLRRMRVLLLAILPIALWAAALFVAVWSIALAMAGALRSPVAFGASAAVPLALCVLVLAGVLGGSLWRSEP
ncbi:hypothetical protein [Frigoribacterium sp. R86507]|uniref:hypothetical protein n=1 Tax=Frigoribacterium sp. R86507 TaxID=3093850 RepID=UPI0037CBF90C